jgi:hypothetical protein
MADELTGLDFTGGLIQELEKAGRDGVRVTPVNVVAVGELIKQDQAHAYLNGFGYLCVRTP